MSEWREAALGPIADAAGGLIRTGPFGSQLHKHDYVDDGPVIVVMPKDMTQGRISTESIARISDETALQLSEHVLQAGDIVLARRGDIGRAAWVDERDGRVLCGTGSMRIHLPAGDLSTRYLHYFLQTEEAINWLQGQAVGATMPNLNAEIVRSLPIRYPSLKAQRRVTDVLDAIDDLIENNRRRIALLERLAQAIYREWFVHFRYPGHADNERVDSSLGPIPAGWEVLRVEEVATIVRGRSYRGTELVEEGGVPFINLKCMERGGGFRRDGLKRYTGDFKAEQAAQPGDIVLAVTDLTQAREILARATLVPRLSEVGAVISLDVARVVPKDADDRLPLFAVLRYSDLADRVKEFANGSTVLHLSPDHIAAADIIWPSESVRRQMNDVLGSTYEMVDELNDAIDRLASLRNLLLPKLVTGAIDVSHLDLDALLDGNDGKASADHLSEGDN